MAAISIEENKVLVMNQLKIGLGMFLSTTNACTHVMAS